MILSSKSKDWDAFCSLLEGEEGCNFRTEKGVDCWTCKGGTNKDFAKKILKEYFPKYDLKGTLEYFEANGGYCDCEILFNVNGEG